MPLPSPRAQCARGQTTQSSQPARWMNVPEINRDNNDCPGEGCRLSTVALGGGSGGDGNGTGNDGAEDRLHGYDKVLSVVVALYALQQRRREEDPAPSMTSGQGAAVYDTGSSDGAVLLSSAKGVTAAAAASASATTTAATEGIAAYVDDWEGEASALVTKLRALRDSYSSEVGVSIFFCLALDVLSYHVNASSIVESNSRPEVTSSILPSCPRDVLRGGHRGTYCSNVRERRASASERLSEVGPQVACAFM